MKHTSVQFLFDVGSNNAYLAHKVIPRIEARTGASFEYVPVLLGGIFKLTNNRSPAEAFADVANKRAYERLEVKRFLERYEIRDYKWNPSFPLSTLKVMRGAVAAQQLNCFRAYVDAVFSAMWERELNLGDPEVLGVTLAEAGLDASALINAMDDPQVKQILMSNTEAAVKKGAFGAPTFFVNSEIFFGKDRLREVEEQIVRSRDA